MLRFVIPLVVALATCVQPMQQRSAMPSYSAASESQIKFAIENNYDDTGPGAKTPDYAYNTYKTLEEALVSYIDDPDTKLPEAERMKAINRLINTQRYNPSENIREYPKSVAEYMGFRQIPQVPPIVLKKYSWPEKQVPYQNPRTNVGVYDLRGISLSNFNSVDQQQRPYGPLTQANIGYLPYRSKINQHQQSFEASPQYSFSYGLRDRLSGDSKSAHDPRSQSPVRGFYTFTGPDGKQHTVHYNADNQ